MTKIQGWRKGTQEGIKVKLLEAIIRVVESSKQSAEVSGNFKAIKMEEIYFPHIYG